MTPRLCRTTAPRSRYVIAASALVLSVAAAAAAPPADFTVRAGTREFKLSSARGQYVALHFLLKTECPLCLRYTMEYAEKAPSVAGVVHVFLKPDSPEEIDAWAAKLNGAAAALPIFHDEGARLAKAYDVPDGFKFHGEVVHFPALILLGPDGGEILRHVGKDNTDRLPFSDFAQAVARHADTPTARHANLDRAGLAVQGYDVVSYFETGEAQMGKPDLASTWRGGTYRFATPEHRAAFAADPNKYEPAYGGWCATAIAVKEEKVEIDPANFKITDGRLFLFYKGWLGDARKDWLKDEPNLIPRGDRAWAEIASK